MASSSVDKTIKLWDPTTGKLRQTLNGWVRSVDFSPDSQLLASSSDDKTIKLWDPTMGKLRQTPNDHSHRVWSEINARVSILQNQWICHQGEKMLWFPLEYRPTCSAMKDGILTLGHASGRVSIISRFI